MKGEIRCHHTFHRVADEILEHLLTEVSTEMEHICDSCVDDLYTEEFARPGNV